MHDDGDWDSELGEGLIDLFVDLGIISWPSFFILLAGLLCLAYHYWG